MRVLIFTILLPLLCLFSCKKEKSIAEQQTIINEVEKPIPSFNTEISDLKRGEVTFDFKIADASKAISYEVSIGIAIDKADLARYPIAIIAGGESFSYIDAYLEPNTNYFYQFSVTNSANDELIVTEIESFQTADFNPIEMVLVEGGNYFMQTENEYGQEITHNKTMNSFYIAKYEMSFAEYAKYYYANYANKNAQNSDSKERAYIDKRPDDDIKPIPLKYFDITLLLQWINEQEGEKYRLATEAEWQYAAEGGQLSSNYTYSGSNIASEVAFFGEYEPVYTSAHDKASLKPNELGIYDMSGNLAEICLNDEGQFIYKGGSMEFGMELCNPRKMRSVDFNKYYGIRLVKDLD